MDKEESIWEDVEPDADIYADGPHNFLGQLIVKVRNVREHFVACRRPEGDDGD